jgi:hypothetical protein
VKMQFRSNTGPTSAVNLRLSLVGDAAVLPKSSPEPNGYPTDTQGIPKGYPREQQARNAGSTPEQHASSALEPGPPQQARVASNISMPGHGFSINGPGLSRVTVLA